MKNFLTTLLRKKVVMGFIIVLLLGGGYWYFQSSRTTNAEVRYVMAPVTKGTLILAVAGTGQVAVSNQVDIKPQTSGQVIAVNVKNGQKINAGAVLATLNTKDASKAVRDAELNLESSRLALQKLQLAASADSLLQAQNSLKGAQDTVAKLKLSQPVDGQKAVEAHQKAQDNLTKVFDDIYSTVADTYLDLPSVVTKLYDVLYSSQIGASEPAIGSGKANIDALLNATMLEDRDTLQPFQTSAEADYKDARINYDASIANYKNTSRTADQATVEKLLADTLDTTKLISQAIKSETNYLDTWADLQTKHAQTVYAKVKDYQSSLATYIGQTDTDLSNLLSVQSTLKDDRQTLTNADRDLQQLQQNAPLDLAAAELAVKQKQAALNDLQAGPNTLDLQTQELAIRQKENALNDAKQTLSDYVVRAPFDAVVAKVSVARGDTVSGSTVIATVITKQLLAQISLNEVDVAKVKVGQKATLTFDAVDGLSISGEVAEIDALGTVTQGVVTYNVKVAFDTQDERIKPGMSVSAAIITDLKQDVLLIPNAALKTQGNTQYVEMPDPSSPLAGVTGSTPITLPVPPLQQNVDVGLSNDTSTEILSNLKEGDEVIVRTVTAGQTASSSSPAAGGLRIPGITGGGGFGGGAGAAGTRRSN